MGKLISALLYFVALVLSRSPIRALEEKFRIDDLEIQLGESEGLSTSSTISPDSLQRILNGVENGNKENIYFYGLLKLYGISLSKDLLTAAQNFNRASSLGHKEATTAYGVMLMSGHGVKKDAVGAMKYFRKGVEMGDMVRELLLFLLPKYLRTYLPYLTICTVLH
jgi:TPR repeat protein